MTHLDQSDPPLQWGQQPHPPHPRHSALGVHCSWLDRWPPLSRYSLDLYCAPMSCQYKRERMARAPLVWKTAMKALKQRKTTYQRQRHALPFAVDAYGGRVSPPLRWRTAPACPVAEERTLLTTLSSLPRLSQSCEADARRLRSPRSPRCVGEKEWRWTWEVGRTLKDGRMVVVAV